MSDDMAEEISANMISDYDSDKSGGITVKESGLSDDDFTTLDTDGDGSLTSSELKTGLTSNNQSLSALMPPPPSGVGGGKMGQGMPDEIASKIADSMVSQYDTDSSGSLSAEESGLTDDEFGGLDTDGDGILSTAELQAGLTSNNQSLSKLMPEPPSGGQPPQDASTSSDSSDDSETSTTLSQYATTQGLAAYRNTMTSDLFDSLSSMTSSLSVAA
jgi:Ca2+-binding EF-hand superfamily protein